MSIPFNRINEEAKHSSGGITFAALAAEQVQKCPSQEKNVGEADCASQDGDMQLPEHISPPRRVCDEAIADDISILTMEDGLQEKAKRTTVDYNDQKFTCQHCQGNCIRRRQCCRDTENCCLLDRQGSKIIFRCLTANREVEVGVRCEQYIYKTYGFLPPTFHSKPNRTMFIFVKNDCNVFSDVGATGDTWPRLF